MNRLILSLALSAILAGQSAFENLAAQSAAAREAERLDDALALYRKGVALKPSWAEGWWYAGTLLYDKTQYREAAQAFEKAAALSPKDGTPLVMLGLCERELGEDERALADIDKGNRLGLAEDPHLRQVVLFTEAKLLQEKAASKTPSAGSIRSAFKDSRATR